MYYQINKVSSNQISKAERSVIFVTFARQFVVTLVTLVVEELNDFFVILPEMFETFESDHHPVPQEPLLHHE